MKKDLIFKLVFSFASALKFTAGTLATYLFASGQEGFWMLFGGIFLYFAAIISLWMVFDYNV